MKKGLIYRATSPSGKIYIGKTVNFNKRKSDHKRASFNVASREYNLTFHCAIRKYGWENIEWDILEEDVLNKDLANKEVSYIKKFLSTNSDVGYNETLGGDGGNLWQHFSTEKKDKIREKISKALTGRKLPPKTKKQIEKHAAAMKGKTPWNKGLKTGPLSEETKNKMSLAHKGEKKRPFTEEHKKNISLARKGRRGYWTGKKRPDMIGEHNPMKKADICEKVSKALTGIKRSEETKKKISESKKGKSWSTQRREAFLNKKSPS